MAIWIVARRGEIGREADAPFLGSMACRDCHQTFYEKWAGSWHGLAMQPFTAEFARRSLTPQESPIVVRDRSYRAEFAEDGVTVRETGPDGEKRLPIAHVLGGKNLFYFLTPWRGGRLQVLPLAYDTRKKEWYDSAASMVRHFQETPDDPVHWTDRLLTFNASCFGCHVSQISNDYSPETDSYHTTWTEPGINCESCHGPGRKHVQVSIAANGKVPEPLEIVKTRDFTHEQTNAMCASCHAKLTPLTPGFRPGERFFDHFGLVTLEDRDLYPDARELGENYTWGPSLASPCVASGRLDCMHCHTSSGRNKHAGEDADRACLPCHEKHVLDPGAHSFHDPKSEASRCVSCHMPMTTFARMQRHDHTLLPPTPAATIEFQSPNACNLCHEEEDARWADEWVRKWYPRDYQEPLLRRARLIAAARSRDWTRLDDMVAYISSKERNVLFASGLLRLLDSCPRPGKWAAFFAAARDAHPLVRSSACRGLERCPDPKAVEVLLEATGDEYRLVRIEAAGALGHRPLPGLDARRRAQVEKAREEHLAFLTARQDDPASHYNLANWLQEGNDLEGAVRAYERALQLDPAFVPALVNASMVHARRGEPARAEAVLRDALRASPKSAEAHFNLGLLLAEQGRLSAAEDSLRKALEHDPRSAQAAYNLGVLLAEKEPRASLELCRRAAELVPEEPRYAYTLAYYQFRAESLDEAEATLRRLLDLHPLEGEAIGLLATILEQTGRKDEALEIYRDALGRSEVSPPMRRDFASRVAELERR